MEQNRAYVFDNTRASFQSAWVALRETMTNNSLSVWGFVLVRCTYKSDAVWEAFLFDFKERARYGAGDVPEDRDFRLGVDARLKWTVIEDRERLEGVSMPVASVAFKDWVETTSREELRDNEATFDTQLCFPRYRLFIYVDELALDVIDAPESQTRQQYRTALVNMWLSLNPPDPEEWAREAFWPLEEEPDNSFMRIDAAEAVYLFASCLDINNWDYEWQLWQEKIAAQAKDVVKRTVHNGLSI